VTAVAAAPFDRAAATYDATFTELHLGRLHRAQVWSRLDRAFGVGDRVLELGCGTGLDAVHLAGRGVHVTATDSSPAMLEQARRRVIDCHADDLVRLECLDLATLTPETVRSRWPDPFDGAMSSFGALNCVADRRRVATALAAAVAIGGRLILTVMGPFVPWEIGWHLAHREGRRAIRRFRGGAVAQVGDGGQVHVWYPSPRTLRAELAPWFSTVRLRGVGVVLPPTGLSAAMEHRRSLLRATAAVERRVTRLPGSAWVADHYLMELVRA
jgi:SAM-dependent methyltransferase